MSLHQKPVHHQILFLIFFVLLIQIVVRYYAPLLVIDQFYLLTFILRLIAPALLCFLFFKFSYKDLGLQWPKTSKKSKFWLAAYFVVLPIGMLIILKDDRYLQYYSASYANTSISGWERIFLFSQFTSSTFFGWEFLHRSVLFFGSLCLFQKAGIDKNIRLSVSIALTASFECLFHLIKPDLETWGLLIASPIFCLIAYRTKSILIPLLMHLYIELLFIGYVVTSTWSSS